MDCSLEMFCITPSVMLKPIFEALRMIKENSQDEKVRTLKTLIVPNKKASEEAKLINGAGVAFFFEPTH